MKSLSALVAVVILCASLGGCVRADNTTGVNNLWRKCGHTFVKGQTTEQQVLDALGPPSQLIALKEHTVYYYLLEGSQKRGVILLVYNSNKTDVRYDRAIFFFDKNGVLDRWSCSNECLCLREGPECCPPAQRCTPTGTPPCGTVTPTCR